MITKRPLVSIGVPVYDGEKYIRRALDSLLAQDYENFELIISDNASTDDTLQICRRYATRDKRIRLNVNTYNLGVVPNFRAVLEMARGEYFMWAAVDDFWYPNFISTLLNELIKYPDVGVAMCAVERVREDGTFHDLIRFNDKDNPNRKSHLAMCLAFPSLLKYNLFINGIFRRNILNRNSSFPTDEVSAADRWFLCILSLKTKFIYVDEVLHVRTIRTGHFSERYPDDQYGKTKRKSKEKTFDFQPIFYLTRNILRTNVIPRHRKCYLPLILFKYVFFQMRLKFFYVLRQLKNNPWLITIYNFFRNDT